jgi:hypothetical protein
MVRRGTAPLILALLVVASAGAATPAQGEGCLAGPNAPSPQGSHWFYRIDRATHRKCWYLGDAKRQRASTQTNTRRRAAPPPEEAEEEPAPPAVVAREAAPDPGVATRWPEAAPAAAIVAGPRAEATRIASAAPLPEPLGARPVTTERVRSEPAPAKVAEAAKPQAAVPAPAPAAASDARGAVPAALFGIALLLAVVGIMLVRARRRMIRTPRRYAWPSASAPRAAGRARRSLREILAQAEGSDEPAARMERGPGFRSASSGLQAPAPDIAAATLQPAIDPLPPEVIAPAPDVEQSLRRLLAAWEGRAAA